MQHWPNLFIAGAPKCGTSSLHAYLQQVPGIYMSRIKEPKYFCPVAIPDDHPIKPIRDRDRYLRLFAEGATARYRGEASPDYLEDPQAPYLIREVSPEAKVIVSLRDPVERLYSHYLMLRNNRTAFGTFAEEIRRGLELQSNRSLSLLWPDTGRYFEQVQRFREVFGVTGLQVLIYEEFAADVQGAVRQVLQFLDIEYPVADIDPDAHRQHSEARGQWVRYLWANKTISRAAESWVPPRARKFVREKFLVKQVPKPPVDPEARRFLVDFYSEDVRQLSGLLGRSLPWRNFS